MPSAPSRHDREGHPLSIRRHRRCTHDAHGRRRQRKQIGSPHAVLAVVVLAVLALPGVASAHGSAPTVALDFKVSLDRDAPGLSGVHVRVLDGDRAFELRVDEGTQVTVLGTLDEPFLRIGSAGVWVNADSPTAALDRLVAANTKGWVQVGHGATFVWHDHRLRPPPTSVAGPAGRLIVPILVNGKPAKVMGTFVRVDPPSLWPWLVSGLVLAAGLASLTRRRNLRAPLTVSLGLIGGLAALAAVTTFALRTSTTGSIAWVQIGAGLAVALALGGILVRFKGNARAHAAGAIGVIAAAVSLGSLPVFWHGVVISALPATLARAACGTALLAGAAAALMSFLPDFDSGPRRVRR